MSSESSEFLTLSALLDIVKEELVALPAARYSSVAQWQSIRLLIEGL